MSDAERSGPSEGPIVARRSLKPEPSELEELREEVRRLKFNVEASVDLRAHWADRVYDAAFEDGKAAARASHPVAVAPASERREQAAEALWNLNEANERDIPAKRRPWQWAKLIAPMRAEETYQQVDTVLANAAAPIAVAPEQLLGHTRGCALPGDPEAECTCGLEWRIRYTSAFAQYEAWRKRAEEAEGALAGVAETAEREIESRVRVALEAAHVPGVNDGLYKAVLVALAAPAPAAAPPAISAGSAEMLERLHKEDRSVAAPPDLEHVISALSRGNACWCGDVHYPPLNPSWGGEDIP